MRDVVRSGAIARGVNVRRAGLHPGVGDNPAALARHPGAFQPQRRDVRRASKREQNLFCPHSLRPAVLLERDLFRVRLAPGVEQSCAGENRHALAPEDLFQFCCRVRVKVPQDMFAALDQRHFGVESAEELGELDRDGAAAEDDQ